SPHLDRLVPASRIRPCRPHTPQARKPEHHDIGTRGPPPRHRHPQRSEHRCCGPPDASDPSVAEDAAGR
ncbi:hypothetical protein, partial [Nocardioides alcanivorans]|uniref:hypothetical protein n=1 Tax=Nocardioides alcanivorans TaxID=2897352 RepID=UPI001F26AAA6